jgi:hypothetical protein
MTLRLALRTLCFITWIGTTSQTAEALSIHETFTCEDVPRADEIVEWSRLPGRRSYLIQAGDPFPDDLKELTRLTGFDLLQIETVRWPSDDTEAAWKQLAAMDVQFVARDVGGPTQPEIDRLNRIGFKKLHIILRAFPGVADSAKLVQLRGGVSIGFSRGTFPRYEERDGIIALGGLIHTTYYTDLWPWYGHMDALNFLPQSKSLHVTGLYPSAHHYEYLKAIQGLKDVTIDVEFEPSSADEWKKFGTVPVQWVSNGRVPSAQAIKNFEAYPHAKRLVIKQEYPLTADEVRRLTASRLPVEWIHSPQPE